VTNSGQQTVSTHFTRYKFTAFIKAGRWQHRTSTKTADMHQWLPDRPAC